MVGLTPELILVNLIVLGVAMTIHEFAHNYVGHLMGDPVPAQQGRLTLNPFVHINWIGWLMFAIIGFGILGSAPISATRMRDPRWGFLAAVAAGPFSNLALAIVSGILMRILIATGIYGDLNWFIQAFLIQMVFWNVLLFVFNLLPLFPLDGWHIVLSLLPAQWLQRQQVPEFIRSSLRPVSAFLQEPAYTWFRYQMQSYYLFIGLIFISIAISYLRIGLPNPLAILISQPTNWIISLILGI